MVHFKRAHCEERISSPFRKPNRGAIARLRRQLAGRFVPDLLTAGVATLALSSFANADTLQWNSTSSAAFTATNWYNLTTRSEEHTSELQSQSNLVCRL